MSSPHPFRHRTPASVCLLRLSALGDITHTLPVLRTLQEHWPATRLYWVIGKAEYPLVKDIAGVEFIIFDKADGIRGYYRLHKQLRARRFDILLHMQVSLRASLASLFIRAGIRLGFDRPRAKDLQYLFCNHHIRPSSVRQHVVDSLLEFPRYFGLSPVRQWRLPVREDARAAIRRTLRGAVNHDNLPPVLVINPCAVAKARNWRNWTATGYAAVADHAQTRKNMLVVLSGGPSAQERQMAQAICQHCRQPPVNLVGQTRLDELVALLDMARVVIAPDTGPAHIASALGTPTIGLYATTNPQRAGPYRYLDTVIDCYPQALRQYRQTDVDSAPWGTRIKTAEAMRLILVEQVVERLDALLDRPPPTSP